MDFTPTRLLEDQRLLTAEEFEALLRQGLFADEHVELIHGRIVMLMAQGPRHIGRVNWLTALLSELLAEAYGVGQRQVALQVQSTSRIAGPAAGEHSMPEPDLMLLSAERAFTGAPVRPDEVYLVVEVADASLEKDLDEKARLYAALGVRLLWVLDLPHRRLHVLRDPDTDGARYLGRQALDAGEARIEPLPELPPVPVERLFERMGDA